MLLTKVQQMFVKINDLAELMERRLDRSTPSRTTTVSTVTMVTTTTMVTTVTMVTNVNKNSVF